jgi:hypothetical protein
MPVRIHGVVLVILACLLSACIHTEDVHIRTTPTQEKQPFSEIDLNDLQPAVLNASPYEHVSFGLEPKESFDLYTVEQDERGVLFQRDQIDVIRKRIEERAGGNGAIIIVYVHGWKHNAVPCDDNMSCFRTILQQVAKTENAASASLTKGYPRRIVSGIYVGWRGLAACNSISKQLSFFSRKRVAERIGAAQTRVLLQNLRDLRKKLNEANKLTKTRLVIVGHSLGAGLIQSAAITELQQDLYSAKAQVENQPGKAVPPLEGFGDLVVLVNPAFEAQLFDTFPREVRKLQAQSHRFSNDRPVLIIVSSTGDVPTHYLFPVVRSFGLLLQPLKLARGPRFWYRYVVTAGNYVGYRTHVATLRGDVRSDARGATKAAREDTRCFSPAKGRGLNSVPSDCSCSQQTGDIDVTPTIPANMMEPHQEIKLSHVTLTPIDRFDRDPYWVIKAHTNVVKDHGDIFNPTLTSMIRELVVGALRPDDTP